MKYSCYRWFAVTWLCWCTECRWRARSEEQWRKIRTILLYYTACHWGCRYQQL